MNYYIPEDFKEFLDKINPDLFLIDMKKIGEIDIISGNYSYDCYHLCRNSVAWILKQLVDKPWYLVEFKIVEGSFKNQDHCWIQIGDYYLDITLAQFIHDAPKIAITLIEESQDYKPYQIYNDYQEWVKIQ